MFLSHPPIATKPSMPWQPTTVSIESAITSRDTSEYFIPSVPIEMPSEIVIVSKMMALPPAAFAPASDSSANLSMCILHGVTMLQVDATPMIGFEKSSCLNPTGYSIARLGARSGPSNTMLECGRNDPLPLLFSLIFAVRLGTRRRTLKSKVSQILVLRDFAENFAHLGPGAERAHFDQRHRPAGDFGDFLDRFIFNLEQRDDHARGG